MERRIQAPDQELPTPSEAAKWLGVPPTTLENWIKKGLVPAPRVINRLVQFYPWEVVYAMKVLLGNGFLPLNTPAENASSGG